MNEIADKITLQRNRESHEMLMSQVCARNLKRIFQVDPDQVWLRDLDTGTAYFPDSEGCFKLKESGIKYFQDLIVEGPSAIIPTHNRPSTSGSVTGGLTHGSLPQLPALIPPGKLSNTPRVSLGGSSSTFALKITKAIAVTNNSASTSKASVDFRPIAQIYIDITEHSANVANIKSCIQKKWGTQYILVGGDGVELEECPGTEGLAFWRAPKRRFYAIEKEEERTGEKRSRMTDDMVENKRIKIDDVCSELRSIKRDLENLNELKGSITEIQKDVSGIISVNSKMNIPIGLRQSLTDAFMCKICHIFPMKPPLIFTKCCKAIIGCEEYINKWYSGKEALTKPCPLCRKVRGYNETSLVLGFNDFVRDLEVVIGSSHDEAEAETQD